MTANARLRRLLRFSALLLTVVMIAVLGRVLWRDGPAALNAWRAAREQWPWVAFSVACALAGHASFVVGWRRLLSDSGVRARFWTLARIFLVSNLGRYLPAGKAWKMAIVAMIGAEEKLSPTILAGSSLFQGIVGVIVGAIVVFAAGGATIGLTMAWLIVPVAAVMALLVAPFAMRSLPRVRDRSSRD